MKLKTFLVILFFTLSFIFLNCGKESNNTIIFPLIDNTNNNMVIQVEVGALHSCALLSNGAVKCWGLNSEWELGNGTDTNSNIPVLVSGISSSKDISAGRFHGCILLLDGSMKCWGYNGVGQLGNGTNTDSNIAIPVSSQLYAFP